MMDRQPAEPAAGRFFLYDSDNDDESPAGSAENGFNNGRSDSTSSTVWVFGYGSLCWNPGFEFTKCVTGYIRGYVRRFWQGNDSHRGTKENPGRVATLIDQPQGITWGCAYKLNGTAALDYLRQRECTLGGYITTYTKFYPRHAAADDATDGIPDADSYGISFPALLYVATAANRQWLGDGQAADLARQIVNSRGPSGHNVEYVVRLANFMRDEVHGADDEHLFELERLVLQLLADRKVALRDLMGEQPPQRVRRDTYQEEASVRRPRSFEYRSRVPDVKLRCLNI